MIITTTSTIEGDPIKQYLGIATGEVIMGANVLRDFKASITDFIGGRSRAYEGKLQEARDAAFAEMTQKASGMGANGTTIQVAAFSFHIVITLCPQVSACGSATP